MKTGKMKAACLVLTGVTAVGLLSGCKTSVPGEQEGSVVNQTIEFWYHDGNPNSNAIFEELIIQFEEQNPGFQVNYVGLPSDSYLQKYNTAIASNTGPDIVSVRDNDVSTLINQGSLMNVEDAFQEFEERDYFNERVLKAIRNCAPDGRLHCLPQYITPDIFWYNTEALEEAGLKAPGTIMEFMEYCEKFAAPGNGTYFYSLRGGSGSLDNLFDFIFTYANQDQLFDKEGNCVLNQPVFAEALDAYASIYWNGWVSKDSVSNSFKEMVSEFGSGTSLSIAHNSSSLAEHQKNLGEGSFMNALAPSNEDGFIVTKDVPFLAYAVFEAAKNKEGAVKFLEFLVSSEAASYVCEKDGRVPVNTLIYEDEWYQNNPYMAVYEELMNSDNVKFLPRPVWLSQWNGFLTKIQEPDFQGILLKEKTTKEVLKKWADYLSEAQKEYLDSVAK